MKLYYGTKTAWTGDLIREVIWLCGDTYWSEEGVSHNYFSNLKGSLVMTAEAILTKNSRRNYRFTIESYFHQLFKIRPDPEEAFWDWDWSKFRMRGRIPYGASGYFTVELAGEGGGLTLDINSFSEGIEIRTWEQDIMVGWLHKWNWQILRLPIVVGSRKMCLGEYLATELFANCGDEGGRNATLDEIEDRGQRWLLS